MRLLIVEDDIRVGALLERGLTDEGYEVERAISGKEALTKRLTSHHDIILLDHMMPGMTGIEVARALRTGGDDTPIIMLTARDAPEDRQLGLEAGANGFMAKPFRFDELFAEIERLLPTGA